MPERRAHRACVKPWLEPGAHRWPSAGRPRMRLEARGWQVTRCGYCSFRAPARGGSDPSFIERILTGSWCVIESAPEGRGRAAGRVTNLRQHTRSPLFLVAIGVALMA